VCPIIGGIFCIAISKRTSLIIPLVIAIIGFLIGACESFVNGLEADYFHKIVGCYSTITQQYYGSKATAGFTIVSTSIPSSNYVTYKNSCYCYTSGGLSCDFYTLSTQGDDCGQIMTTYADILSASTAFSCVLTLSMFVYSILACRNVCCCKTNNNNSVSMNNVEVPPNEIGHKQHYECVVLVLSEEA